MLHDGIIDYGLNIGLAWAKNQSELVKFIVVDFGLSEFGKTNREIRVKSPNSWEKFEFKGIRVVKDMMWGMNLQVVEMNLTWNGRISCFNSHFRVAGSLVNRRLGSCLISFDLVINGPY
jgi:hypothetical protein